jgi:membrane fusion protein, multidrug efflux system
MPPRCLLFLHQPCPVSRAPAARLSALLRAVLIITGAACAMWGFAGCDRTGAAGGGGAGSRGGGPSQPPEVRTVAAWTGQVETVVRSVGQIRAVDSVTLASEVAGMVRTIHFDEGAAVQAGDLIIELDDTRARAELQSAKAVRDRAARQLERYEQAASTSAAGLPELDTVRTELAQAEAQYELAQIRVRDHRIAAPFDGVVGLRLVSPGAYIQPGTALTTLTTVDPVDVEFAVPELYLASLRPGLTVAARSPAYDSEFPAMVRVVTPQIDPSTRTALVLARADNPGGLLRPGMFVNVRLVLGTRDDAVLIPESALQFQGSQASLYTVEPGAEGDEVRSRRIRLGERRGAIVEVLEGVGAGERVVVSGLQRIRDGVRVRAVPEQPTAVAPDRESPAPAAGGSAGGAG